MEPVDYELAYIDALLTAEDPAAMQRWQEVFEQSVENWLPNRSRNLLRQAKTLPLTPNQEALVRHYEGLLHARMGSWEAAQEAYERALEIRRSFGDSHGELVTLNALANLLRRGSQPLTEALLCYQQAAQLAAELHEEDSRLQVVLGMGLTHYDLGNFEQAHDCYQQVLGFAQQTQNTELKAAALHNLGSLAWTQGRLEEAEEYFQQALTCEQTLGDWHGEAESLNSLGLIQEAVGDWPSAKTSYGDSLAIFQRAGDLYGQAQVLVNLGNLAWLEENLDEALNLHEQAMAMAEELGDPKLEGQALTGIGDTLRALHQYEEAENILLQAIQKKQAAGDERSLKHTYLSLGALFQNQERPADAQRVYELALAAARQQKDQRIEATTLVNLSNLMLPQARIAEAYQYLDQAEAIAIARDYRDCLAEIADQRGDLELFKEEPDAEKLLQYSFEAMAYAGDFNQQLLQKILRNLVRFWQANAEDGGVETTIWFCNSMVKLWKNTGMADSHPEVIEAFEQLANRVGR